MYPPYLFHQHLKLLIKLEGAIYSKKVQMFPKFCNHLLHRKITSLILFHLTHLLLNSCDVTAKTVLHRNV